MERSTKRALWLVALAWLLTRARSDAPQPHDKPIPPPPPPPPAPQPGEATAIKTTSTAPDVAGAIVRGYTALKGKPPPSSSSWLWPLALSANETDSWFAMYNWNAGDVKAVGTQSWFTHPLVTGQGNRFADFPNLDAGVLSMLRTLDAHGGLAAADAGDAAGWQSALNAYLGSTYPNLSALISRLAATVPAS